MINALASAAFSDEGKARRLQHKVRFYVSWMNDFSARLAANNITTDMLEGFDLSTMAGYIAELLDDPAAVAAVRRYCPEPDSVLALATSVREALERIRVHHARVLSAYTDAEGHVIELKRNGLLAEDQAFMMGLTVDQLEIAYEQYGANGTPHLTATHKTQLAQAFKDELG